VIFVDSSVWIDYFRGVPTAEANYLDTLLGKDDLVTGDLVLTEVLQGFGSDRDFRTGLDLLTAFPIVEIGGRENAIEAARNFRRLRDHGVTVRKTIDTLIVTWCLRTNAVLLHRDRDFGAFEDHLGLKSAMPGT